jgi:arylsulfatase
LPPKAVLSPSEGTDWNAVEDPAYETRRMQVYAAMVDRLDQNVGRLLETLETEGLIDNTIVFFLSDNGGCPNGLDRTPEVEVGSPQSFVAYGKAWANVSNTPYRKFKAMEHEGGLLTPLIAHWPAGLPQKGLITHQPAHIIDFMATCLDLAGAEYPGTVEGKEVLPMVGKSFLPQLRGKSADVERKLFWEHEGNKAVRHGPWKLVKRHPQDWELYNLEQDPTELHDLSTDFPDRVTSLSADYARWAQRNGVKDWPVEH